MTISTNDSIEMNMSDCNVPLGTWVLITIMQIP
jgi:hypothetical protein